MSIKPIDSIPTQINKMGQRDNIRADIQEALDKGITAFEFTGDYNYKYLAQYAREEAITMIFHFVRETQRKFKAVNYTDEEKNLKGFYVFYPLAWEYKNEWIHISSCKGEEHQRVFCKIDDYKILENKIIEDCQNNLAEARQYFHLEDGKWINERRRR